MFLKERLSEVTKVEWQRKYRFYVIKREALIIVDVSFFLMTVENR